MKHKAKTWNYCWPDDPQPGLLHLEPPALSGEATFWVQCGGGTSEEQNKIADCIAALWNAAEELGLTTEKVTESEIQRTFRLVESHSGVIEVALQRIEKLEAEKAAVIQVLERIRDESGPFNLGEMRKLVESAIRKARGEE